MTDFWIEKEAERKRTLEACQRAVGIQVKPASYGGDPKTRAQHEAEDRRRRAWLARHRRDYPGW